MTTVFAGFGRAVLRNKEHQLNTQDIKAAREALNNMDDYARAALAATTAADMPPPKYASVMAIADEFGSGAVAYTADEVRAALAAQQNSASNSSNNSASQQAEPVAQYRPKRPADSPWHDVIKGRPCILPDDLYEVRTLYRAAPPQQIEPLCCNHNCNQGRDCPYRKGEQK